MQRVAIFVRVPEGTSGSITAYVMPKNPPKTCNRIVCHVHALSMHQRIRALDSSLPLAHLDISGDFLASDAHQWLSSCLPDMPALASMGQEAIQAYESTALGTQLAVSYRDGALRLSSDNPCALAMAREVVMRCDGFLDRFWCHLRGGQAQVELHAVAACIQFQACCTGHHTRTDRDNLMAGRSTSGASASRC